MIIEPCCCERQLPLLLKEAGDGRVAVFTTSGDVTIRLMMKSVACMVSRCHTMTLATDGELTVELLRLLRYWIGRGWLSRVRLVTLTDQKELVGQELSDVTDKVEVTVDRMLRTSLLCFAGDGGMVVIQGDMLCDADPGLRHYSAVISRKGVECTAVKDMMQAVESRIKLAHRKRSDKKVAINKKEKDDKTTKTMEGTPAAEAEVTRDAEPADDAGQDRADDADGTAGVEREDAAAVH